MLLSFRRVLLIPILLFLVLSGCSFAPVYERPTLPVPETFDVKTEDRSTESTSLSWQDFFLDETLKARIQEAFTHNRDIKLAALAVQESKAQYGVQNAERFPAIDALAGSEYIGGPRRDTQKRYDINLGTTAFELDFFGRIKNMSDAALEKYLASTEAEKTAKLLLIKQVAQAHYALRFAHERQKIAQESLKNVEFSHDLLLSRLKSGQTSAFDLTRSQSQIKQFKSVEIKREREIIQAKNALSLLIGQFHAIPEGAALSFSQHQFLPLSQNISSTILLARPDVMEAEHNLRASNADIGAARAAFFPTISLTGTLGYMSDDFSSLFTSPSAAWTFLPRISLPIFNAGKNAGNLELANIRKESAIVRYEKTIQEAFRETADALMTKEYFALQRDALAKSIQAQKQAHELARGRLIHGTANYQEILDTERTLYESSIDELDILQEEILNTINLYIALGGSYGTSSEHSKSMNKN